MAEFVMPSLGADMEAGTLIEWRVKPGDRVKRGDIVASVDTDKAEIDVEIFEDGVIGELLVDTGTRVPVGTPLATVLSSAVAAPPPPPAPPPPAPDPVPAPPPAITAEHRPRVSPLARRVAAGKGVDLAGVRGTGPHGAITRADVEAAAPVTATPAPAPAPPATAHATPAAERAAAMRHAIGDLMARSKREIPHYYLETAIDMSATIDWLREQNAERAPADRLVPAAVLLAAAARAVRAVPEINGFYVDGALEICDHVHLGVAISLRRGGLVAPAIHDADQLTPDALMAALGDLVTRARGGALRGSEMSDPTLTVTNLGERGADKVLGVIYPPQVALVGFGAVRERPWAADGMIGARPVVIATLAADHRASDGHRGGLYLAEVARLLQTPEEL